MRFAALVSAAVLLGAVWANEAAETPESSDVLSVTQSDFSTLVEKEPLILVEFFAPWCGHCKALAPHYEEAATKLKEKNIKLAKVDCVDQADLCQTHGVQGYPTLKVFRNGTPTAYNGPRKADGIISYMVKQSLPAVSAVTAENHAEFKGSDKIVVVAYASSTTDAPAPAFSEVAEKHRDDYLFGITTDSAVITEAGVTPPAVVVYRKFDEPRLDFDHKTFTADELASFIKSNSMPLVDEVGPENYGDYANAGIPLAYLFLDPADEKHADYVAMVKEAAKKHKGKINYVYIDAVKFADHGKALNLNGEWPAFVIQDIDKQLKYPFESNELTAASITAFSDAFVAGDIKPKLKSEPVPASQDESVHVLVGSEFDKVIFDDSKDVFVEFYAPWCGHCKRLKPTWDSLGDKYAAAKDRITIAKMDATENDIPPSAPFRVSGFPTIKFKKAGTREFIDYEGDRSLESLIAFVAANAANSLETAGSASSSSAAAEESTAASTPSATEAAETATQTPDRHEEL